MKLKGDGVRHSTLNKTKSPVVGKNIRARASQANEEKVERNVEERPLQPGKKVTKSIGIGRHRSEVKEDDGRDDGLSVFPASQSVVSASPSVLTTGTKEEREQSGNVHYVENEESSSQAPFCGCL